MRCMPTTSGGTAKYDAYSLTTGVRFVKILIDKKLEGATEEQVLDRCSGLMSNERLFIVPADTPVHIGKRQYLGDAIPKIIPFGEENETWTTYAKNGGDAEEE